ncbi:MAG: hypothetical protein V1917_00930 [Candidatus Gottesmanbacteria bacterium]
MSKKRITISNTVMDAIHSHRVIMRPKLFFVIGSIMSIAGMTASFIIAIFGFSIIRFLLRSHGPMKQYRLEQMLQAFPVWSLVVAVVGCIVGIMLLRRYDISYKKNFLLIIGGILLSLVLSVYLLDVTGISDALMRTGPMKRMMRGYETESKKPPFRTGGKFLR